MIYCRCVGDGLLCGGCIGEKCGEGFGMFVDACLRQVRIDPFHGGIICPTADLHGNLLRHIQVKGKRSEAMAQAMNTDLREIILCAELVDAFIDPVGGVIDDIFSLPGRKGERCVQRRYDRYDATGGGVLIFLFMDQLAFRVIDGRTADRDDACIIQPSLLRGSRS